MRLAAWHEGGLRVSSEDASTTAVLGAWVLQQTPPISPNHQQTNAFDRSPCPSLEPFESLTHFPALEETG
jgi:hypothetical protein